MPKEVCGGSFDIKREINYFLRIIKKTKNARAAVREVMADIRGFLNERKNPDNAYSRFGYKLGEDERGLPALVTLKNGIVVRNLLDNFVAIQTTEEGRRIAEEQRDQWLALESVVISSPSGGEVFSFSPKAGRVEEGVALQKIRREGDIFLTEIRVLPKITESEANSLLNNLATSGRRIRNLREGNSSPLFQVVVGNKEDSIDIRTDLPAIIDRVKTPTPLFRHTEPQLTLPRQVFPQIREINSPWVGQGVFQREGYLELTFLPWPIFLPKKASENSPPVELVISPLSINQLSAQPLEHLKNVGEPVALPSKTEIKPQIIEVSSPPEIPEEAVIFEAKKEEKELPLGRMEDLRKPEISGGGNSEVPKGVKGLTPLRCKGRHIELPSLTRTKRRPPLKIGIPLTESRKEEVFQMRNGKLPHAGGVKEESANKQTVKSVGLERKPQNGGLTESLNIESSLISQLQERPPIVIVKKVESVLTPPSIREKQIRRKEIAMVEMVLPKNEVKLRSEDNHQELKNQKSIRQPSEICLVPEGGVKYEIPIFADFQPQVFSELNWFKFLFILGLLGEKIPRIEVVERIEVSRRQPLKPFKKPFFYPLPLWFEVEPESEGGKIGKLLDNKFLNSKQFNYFNLNLFYLWLMIILTKKENLFLSSREFFYKQMTLIQRLENIPFCLLPEISN